MGNSALLHHLETKTFLHLVSVFAHSMVVLPSTLEALLAFRHHFGTLGSAVKDKEKTISEDQSEVVVSSSVLVWHSHTVPISKSLFSGLVRIHRFTVNPARSTTSICNGFG